MNEKTKEGRESKETEGCGRKWERGRVNGSRKVK